MNKTLRGLLKATMPKAKLRAAAIELCNAGLMTCTRGQPGDDDATYALAWLPLDHPERFSADVRAKHTANMKQFQRDDEVNHE